MCVLSFAGLLIPFVLSIIYWLMWRRWRNNIVYYIFLQVHISKEYLQLEPIGLVFVFFFALILIIQFTAMLFHRFGTLSHILAATELNFCCNKKAEELSQDALIDKVWM